MQLWVPLYIGSNQSTRGIPLAGNDCLLLIPAAICNGVEFPISLVARTLADPLSIPWPSTGCPHQESRFSAEHHLLLATGGCLLAVCPDVPEVPTKSQTKLSATISGVSTKKWKNGMRGPCPHRQRQNYRNFCPQTHPESRPRVYCKHPSPEASAAGCLSVDFFILASNHAEGFARPNLCV